MSQGFTLTEVIMVLLITSILTGIAINFNVFSEEATYLKNFNYRLFSDFSLARNLSLSRQLISGTNLFACGYGFLFTSSSYLGYAYVSSSDWLSCDDLASSSPQAYATSYPDYFLHTNGEISQQPIPSLQTKADFKGEIKISTSSSDCSSNNVFSDPLNYSEVAIVYYSPYGDYLFLGNNGSGWQNLGISDIYFCLEYRNEKRYLRLNKVGQLMVNIP